MSTHSQCLLLGDVKTLADDCWVDTLGNVAICLFQELSNKEDYGGGPVTNLIILRNGGTGDHGSSRVLDLHLREEDLAVLCHFDLAGTIDEHLESASWTYSAC